MAATERHLVPISALWEVTHARSDRSSSLLPAALPSSDLDSDPALTSSESPGFSDVAGAETGNACQLPTVRAEPRESSAPSALAERFLVKDHSAFIATSTPSDPPSAPAALTVRPGQLDVQTGIPRFESHATLGDLHLSAAVDVLNVGAHVGRLNEDGSHGANVGWGANLVNGELTMIIAAGASPSARP